MEEGKPDTDPFGTEFAYQTLRRLIPGVSEGLDMERTGSGTLLITPTDGLQYTLELPAMLQPGQTASLHLRQSVEGQSIDDIVEGLSGLRDMERRVAARHGEGEYSAGASTAPDVVEYLHTIRMETVSDLRTLLETLVPDALGTGSPGQPIAGGLGGELADMGGPGPYGAAGAGLGPYTPWDPPGRE